MLRQRTEIEYNKQYLLVRELSEKKVANFNELTGSKMKDFLVGITDWFWI